MAAGAYLLRRRDEMTRNSTSLRAPSGLPATLGRARPSVIVDASGGALLPSPSLHSQMSNGASRGGGTTTLLLAVVLAAALSSLAWSLTRSRKPKDHQQQEQQLLSDAGFNSRLTVVTRVHGASATSMASVADIVAFLRSCEGYASSVVVCIGVGDALEHASYLSEVSSAVQAQTFKKDMPIVVLPVTPWGKFTPALNAALGKVVERGDGFVAFQSLEFRMEAAAVTMLLDYAVADKSVLAIGPRMNGHEFTERGSYSVGLRGRTCPWNTFAIWRTRHLALTGFPTVADGLGSSTGGVEEVAAIALLQKLNPTFKAVLAKVPGVRWETNFSDPKRRAWHEEKMRSKDQRPQQQLEWLGLQSKGVVMHVDFS